MNTCYLYVIQGPGWPTYKHSYPLEAPSLRAARSFGRRLHKALTGEKPGETWDLMETGDPDDIDGAWTLSSFSSRFDTLQG